MNKKFLLDGSQTVNKMMLKKELRRLDSNDGGPGSTSFSSHNLKNCYTNNSTLDKKSNVSPGNRRNEKLGTSTNLPLSKTLDLFDTNHTLGKSGTIT